MIQNAGVEPGVLTQKQLQDETGFCHRYNDKRYKTMSREIAKAQVKL
jgi:hypothetical protein